MKLCGRIFFRPVWIFIAAQLCCGSSRAELLGSPYPEIQKNFNQLLGTNACPGCDLRGAVLNHLNLAAADLQGANLTGAPLNFTCLTKADLRDADLHGAWLIGADLAGADLTGTILEGDAAKTWPKIGRNKTDAKKEEADAPDFCTDWRTDGEGGSHRSVDEVPVIEVVPVPSTAEEIRFWHYLLDLRQAAEQRRGHAQAEKVEPPPSSAAAPAEQARSGQGGAARK